MLGLLLIYFIGKHYYNLAKKYKKIKWLFVVIGIAAYYLVAFVLGLLLGIMDIVFDKEIVDLKERLLISIIALPFGILASYLLYRYLEYIWKKELKGSEVTLDDFS